MNAYALHVNAVRVQLERNFFCRYDGLSWDILCLLMCAQKMCQVKFLVSINDKTFTNEPRNKHENMFQKTMHSFIDHRNIKY